MPFKERFQARPCGRAFNAVLEVKLSVSSWTAAEATRILVIGLGQFVFFPIRFLLKPLFAAKVTPDVDSLASWKSDTPETIKRSHE